MRVSLQHIHFSILLFVCALTALYSCEKQPSSQGGEDVQTGDLVINISSAPTTKSAKDGDEMVNLRVWMVNGSNKVVKYASLTPGAATATVTFDKVDRGAYTLYFLANSTALSGYVEGSTIDSAFLKATLSLGSGAASPVYSDSEGMPLSLIQKCSIGPGVNRISAEIVRVCGLVNITIKNRTTDYALYITSVSLNQKNPSSGYVFAQDDHSSPSGTTYKEFPSTTSFTRIEPTEESQTLSFYLFEDCNSTEAFSLILAGGIYEKDETVTPVDKTSYQATGSASNTTINTSKYYFLASASSQRQFLMADSSGALAIEDVGTDAELFVKSDIENYFWQFGSTGTSTSVKNVGKGTYLGITITRSGFNSYRSSYSLSNTSGTLYTGTSIGRQFYDTNTSNYSTRYSYLYNNSGVVGVTNPSTSTSSATNTGWYLREATQYTYQVLSPEAEKDFINTTSLTYTDRYGIAQPLTSICRNDRLEVVVNVFYNPINSTFDFQVESWRTVNNETTFD